MRFLNTPDLNPRPGMLAGCLCLMSFGSLAADDSPIGYLGFPDHQLWAIQFNDCTVFDYPTAEPYLWFDRSLTQVSCYQIQEADPVELRESPIRIYRLPDSGSEMMEIQYFSELEVLESGWGIFPHVYEQADGNWYRVKEGWVQLGEQDLDYAEFYPGPQNSEARFKHEAYYHEH